MTFFERHERVLLSEVGACVQRWLAEGARLVVISCNPDGQTCCVSLRRD